MADLWQELNSDSLLQIDAGLVKNMGLIIQTLEQSIINAGTAAAETVKGALAAVDAAQTPEAKEAAEALLEEARAIAKATMDPFTKLTIGKTTDLTVEGSTNIIKTRATDILAQVRFEVIEAAFRAFIGEQVQTFGRSVYRSVLQFGFDAQGVANLAGQLAQQGDVDGLVKLSQQAQKVTFSLPTPPALPTPTQ